MSDQQPSLAVNLCDNPLCAKHHGEKGKLWRHSNPSVNWNRSMYNIIELGKIQFTVCRACENAIDMFVGYYRHATTSTKKEHKP